MNLICQGLGTHQQNKEKQICSELHLFHFQNKAEKSFRKSVRKVKKLKELSSNLLQFPY